RFLDEKTIFIVAGDARTNRFSPRSDIFEKLTDKALRTIWLNPEDECDWDTGDSVMYEYSWNCDLVFHCSHPLDLKQLTAKAIFQLGKTDLSDIPQAEWDPEQNQIEHSYQHRSYRPLYGVDWGYDFDYYDDYYY
ncbi:MAG: hypothetical protein ACXQS8_03875, partial [Candidatus Helarchaeales archaeon]